MTPAFKPTGRRRARRRNRGQRKASIAFMRTAPLEKAQEMADTLAHPTVLMPHGLRAHLLAIVGWREGTAKYRVKRAA